MQEPNSSMADLGLVADQVAAQADAEAHRADAEAHRADAASRLPAEHDALAAADAAGVDAAAMRDARVDPLPDAVPGADDSGAQGRDRDHGGWGDRGLFGGRAGGTGA
jgi:hypothetical protein